VSSLIAVAYDDVEAARNVLGTLDELRALSVPAAR
jgi:hypothetical protein